MIKTWGKIWKKGKLVRSDTFISEKSDMSDALLECIEHYGRTFDMEAPMWNSSHTKQLGICQRATFTKEDYIDTIPFDRFELHIIDSD